MDRQTALAFILIGAILVIWLSLSTPDTTTIPPGKPQDTTDVSKKDTFKSPDTTTEENNTKENGKVPDSLKYGEFFSVPSKSEEIITIENDLVLIEFTSRGGNIRKYFLKNFKNWYSAEENGDADIYETRVQLINYTLGGAYDLVFITEDGKKINTANLDFSTNLNKARYKISGSDSLSIVFTLTANNGGQIKKKYTIYGNKYHLGSDIVMAKMSNIISNRAYDLVWSSGIRFVEENSVDEANYSNASVYYGGEQVILDATAEGDTLEKRGKTDWIAVRNKYFAAIVAPKDPSQVEGYYIKGRKKTYGNSGVREFYSAQLNLPFKDTDFEMQSFTVYIGPVDYDILKTYQNNLEAVVDFGSFFGLKFVVRPIAEYVLLPLFTFLHSFIPNYGIVIIVFSLIIKFVLYPLTKQSMQSMKKMQLLQPKMTEIKEKFKDDPQKMNKEMMKLYSTYGVNPAGGCFPLLLQMPIFIALWGLFQVAIELRQQPFMLWITDLSRPDIIYKLPYKFIVIDHISGLAVLMGITTFVQQKMSVKDPKQQALIYIMPIMLTILFMNFPSGLNLYYFMFNVFSIAQQYYINHKHDGMVLEPVKNPKKKKGFMSRLMEAAEQNAKVQQKRRKR
jgi:YidC/Oxa1 family membrane protein insertase